MPKITPPLTEKQFADALRKMGVTEEPKRLLSGRRFTIRVSKGFIVSGVPGVYIGVGLNCRFDADATLRHLKREKATYRAHKPGKPEKKSRAPRQQKLPFDPNKGLSAQGLSDPDPIVRQPAAA